MKDTTWGRYLDDLLTRSMAAYLVILVSTVATAGVLLLRLTLGIPEDHGAITALLVGAVVVVTAGIAQYRLVGPMPSLTQMLALRATLTRSGDSLREALARRLPLAPTLRPEIFVGAMGGGRWCVFRVGAEPLARGMVPGCDALMGVTLGLTFEGFNPGEPRTVEIHRPDGPTIRRNVPPRPSESHLIDWTPMAGDPVGTYTVVARQAKRMGSWSLPVRRPPEPKVAVAPSIGPPGTTFTIFLAGFPPRSIVPIRLHRSTGYREVIIDAERDQYGDMADYDYAATLRPIRVDEHGDAVYRLWTDPDQPDDRWVVETEPGPREGGAVLNRIFQIEARPDPSQIIPHV